MYQLFEIYPNTGRPASHVGQYETKKELRQKIQELTSGNALLEEQYGYRIGDTIEQVTEVDPDTGFWYFKN